MQVQVVYQFARENNSQYPDVTQLRLNFNSRASKSSPVCALSLALSARDACFSTVFSSYSTISPTAVIILAICYFSQMLINVYEIGLTWLENLSHFLYEKFPLSCPRCN